MKNLKKITFITFLSLYGLSAYAQLPKQMETRILSKLPQIDTNSDGKLSTQELEQGRKHFPKKYLAKIDTYLKKNSNIRKPNLKLNNVKADKVLKAIGLTGEQGISYKTTPTNETVLDIIYPKNKKYQKAPLFIYIHGGGYTGGSRNAIYRKSNIVKQLTNAGIAIASIDYRLAGKSEKVMMNEINQDCKDALRFLAKHADKYGIDPHKFITWGTSAGGSLALVAAMTQEDHLAGDVMGQGIAHTVLGSVVYFGATSFVEESVWKNRKWNSKGNLFTANNGLSEENIRKLTSPDLLINKQSPSLLLFYGDKDTTVPVENGRHLNKIAQSMNLDVNYIEIKNAGHGFRNVGGQASMKQDEIEQILIDHVFKWVI